MALSSDGLSSSASENEVNDLADRSLDSIVSWLRDRRSQAPTARLSDLLEHKPLPQDLLLDIACIDLIEQRRNGHPVSVEDYLADFAELRGDAMRLDLIDAEICVDRELGKSPCLEELAQRFPDFRSQICDLLALNPDQQAAVGSISQSLDVGRQTIPLEETGGFDEQQQESLQLALASSRYATSTAGELIEFSIEDALLTKKGGSSTETSHPIDLPEWFVGEQCVASGPGRWLIRGRDTTRGEILAMKVIELPLQITHYQVEQLMDACEAAAKVRNPTWARPAVAAVQNRHLAVIRPWLFANPWHHGSPITPPGARLRQLASVAYALQSAHSVGACHGGIRPSNLLIDHRGKVQLVDCSSSLTIAKRWLQSEHGFACLQERQLLDAQDLIKLAASDAVDWPATWAAQLVSRLRKLADRHREDACGRIGDILMRWADEQANQPSQIPDAGDQATWKRRLAKWISRPSR